MRKVVIGMFRQEIPGLFVISVVEMLRHQDIVQPILTRTWTSKYTLGVEVNTPFVDDAELR